MDAGAFYNSLSLASTSTGEGGECYTFGRKMTVPFPGLHAWPTETTQQPATDNMNGTVVTASVTIPIPLPLTVEVGDKIKGISRPFKLQNSSNEPVPITCWRIDDKHFSTRNPMWDDDTIKSMVEYAASAFTGAPDDIKGVPEALVLVGPGAHATPVPLPKDMANCHGAIIVSLPSDCSGGHVVIKSGQERYEQVLDAQSSCCVEFAACHASARASIAPVAYGYRLLLVYLLMSAETAPKTIGRSLRKMVKLINDARAAPPQVQSGNNVAPAPQHVNLFLDGNYHKTRPFTVASLDASDGMRVDRLTRVAKMHGDCQLMLAKMDVRVQDEGVTVRMTEWVLAHGSTPASTSVRVPPYRSAQYVPTCEDADLEHALGTCMASNWKDTMFDGDDVDNLSEDARYSCTIAVLAFGPHCGWLWHARMHGAASALDAMGDLPPEQQEEALLHMLQHGDLQLSPVEIKLLKERILLSPTDPLIAAMVSALKTPDAVHTFATTLTAHLGPLSLAAIREACLGADLPSSLAAKWACCMILHSLPRGAEHVVLVLACICATFRHGELAVVLGDVLHMIASLPEADQVHTFTRLLQRNLDVVDRHLHDAHVHAQPYLIANAHTLCAAFRAAFSPAKGIHERFLPHLLPLIAQLATAGHTPTMPKDAICDDLLCSIAAPMCVRISMEHAAFRRQFLLHCSTQRRLEPYKLLLQTAQGSILYGLFQLASDSHVPEWVETPVEDSFNRVRCSAFLRALQLMDASRFTVRLCTDMFDRALSVVSPSMPTVTDVQPCYDILMFMLQKSLHVHAPAIVALRTMVLNFLRLLLRFPTGTADVPSASALIRCAYGKESRILPKVDVDDFAYLWAPFYAQVTHPDAAGAAGRASALRAVVDTYVAIDREIVRRQETASSTLYVMPHTIEGCHRDQCGCRDSVRAWLRTNEQRLYMFTHDYAHLVRSFKRLPIEVTMTAETTALLTKVVPEEKSYQLARLKSALNRHRAMDAEWQALRSSLAASTTLQTPVTGAKRGRTPSTAP